ncbi:MAG: TetR/AcrR family transcriptional regulator [Stellaceae bacterium]
MHKLVTKPLPETSTVPAPPRARILAVARDLFYRHGIHAVGVDAIAEAAGTNKMTLYRHFESKDVLIAECLLGLVGELDAAWAEIAETHRGDPLGQLRAWLRRVGEFKLSEADRGCAFVNAAAELADKDHPARRVIEAYKTQNRERLIRLCEEAGLVEPDLLADKMFLLCEGARVSMQSIGPKGPATRLVDILEGLIADHTRKKR